MTVSTSSEGTPIPPRLRERLVKQGYVPSTDPLVKEIYRALDQHYAMVGRDLSAAQDRARDRVLEEMDDWYQEGFPDFAVRERSLVGWVDPKIIVRNSKDKTFPVHHTREDMARYAAATVASPKTHEQSSLELEVRLHSHWRGHIAEITTNGRHRAAIYRAAQIPFVQCQIALPRAGWNFTPTTEREDRLMLWLLDQGLITGYVPPTYKASQGSPLPWLLVSGKDPLGSIPERLTKLENDFGPIDDSRFTPLRTARGIRSVTGGPNPLTATLRNAIGGSPSPPRAAPAPSPTPCHDPAQRALIQGRKVTVPRTVLASLIEPYAHQTATSITERPGMTLHPGDNFGRVLAWLWTEGSEHEAVELVLSLYRALKEQINGPFWDRLMLHVGLSLSEGWICADERAELFEALEDRSPEAQIPSRRPGFGDEQP